MRDESGLSGICQEGLRVWVSCSANLFFTLIFLKFNLMTRKSSKELNYPHYEPAGIWHRAFCSELTEASEELPAQLGPPELDLPVASSSIQEQARQAHVGVRVQVPRVSWQQWGQEGP